MDSPTGQQSSTRDALLYAAAELITERGWNAVTTRAVAERAGVPHGAVSYHFDGKQELLRQAARAALDETFAGLVRLVEDGGSLPALVTDAGAELRAARSAQVDETRLLAECIVQASRDAEVATQFRDWLRAYRQALVSRAAADHDTGRLVAGADPTGTAILLAAAIDGLWLHLACDDELDVERACHTLARLLSPAQEGNRG